MNFMAPSFRLSLRFVMLARTRHAPRAARHAIAPAWSPKLRRAPITAAGHRSPPESDRFATTLTDWRGASGSCYQPDRRTNLRS